MAANAMKDEIGRTTLQLVKQNHATIDKTLAAVNDKTITLLDNHFFSDIEQYRFWTGVETLGQIRTADDILERWSSDGSSYSLYMYNREGKDPLFNMTGKRTGFQYLNADPSRLPEWAADSVREGGKGVLRFIVPEGGSGTVSFIRSILNPKNYNESIGFLVVSNLEVFLKRDMISVQLADRAGIYLFNDQGGLLMREGPDAPVGENMLEEARSRSAGYTFVSEEGEQWLYAYSHSPAFDTRLVYKIPLKSITGGQTAFQWMLMALSAIYLALVLLFVLYLLRMILKPLVQLVSVTKIYEPGKKLEPNERLLRADEFGILYGAFMRMTRRLDQSVEENYVMKIRQKEGELAALHSQITPHLLYNTLDSIYWYALESGNTGVGEMVKDLSRLLRIGLSKGKSIITIKEEVEHVQAYSRLQMKRYPGQFDVRWEVDESLEACLTPKVILQPLVENAIFHGVSGMDGEGEIAIKIRRDGEELRLIVEDNGFVPVDMERLASILEGETSGKGYGIRNVHKRIQLHFGEPYGLRFMERPGGGLIAVINLPLRTAETAME